MQLVFGRDTILSILHKADWKYIKEKKQRLIDLNNKRKNKKKIPHTYQGNDKVLLKRKKRLKHGDREYDGPFTIIAVHDNGSVEFRKPDIPT